MRRKGIALVALLSVLAAPGLIAANAPTLSGMSCAPTMTTISCASPAAPVRVTARIPAPGASARVYFKARGEQDEYYVDMRRSTTDDTMWAFIPAPMTTTPSFTYRIVAMDVAGVQVATPLSTATVTASCPAQSWPAEQQRVASNMIIGLTLPDQSSVPPGFQCRGVVSYITSMGELLPNEECRRILAGGAPSGATTAGTHAAGTAGSAGTGSTATGASAGTNASTTMAGTTGSTATGASATGASGVATGTGVGTTGGGIGLTSATITALTAAALAGAGVAVYKNHQNSNNNQLSQSRP